MSKATFAEPLARLLQAITLQKQTGVLSIEHTEGGRVERGEIYFERGETVQVRLNQTEGEEALRRISNWHITSYTFAPGRSASQDATTTTKQGEQKPVETPRDNIPPTNGTAGGKLAHTQTTNHSAGPREPQRVPAQTGEQAIPVDQWPTEPLPLVHLKLSTAVASVAQPLILHGTTLEVYTPKPAKPLKATRVLERWTTHVASTSEGQIFPSRPPSTPRLWIETQPVAPHLQVLGQLQAEEIGPQATFRTRTISITAKLLHQLERRERIVFILLDGQRTVQDLAHLTHHTELEVKQIVVRLMKRGYAEYVQG